MKNKLSLFASLLVLSIGIFACEQPEDEPNQEQEEVVDIEEPDGPIYDPNLGLIRLPRIDKSIAKQKWNCNV